VSGFNIKAYWFCNWTIGMCHGLINIKVPTTWNRVWITPCLYHSYWGACLWMECYSRQMNVIFRQVDFENWHFNRMHIYGHWWWVYVGYLKMHNVPCPSQEFSLAWCHQCPFFNKKWSMSNVISILSNVQSPGRMTL
jgi:hypothetical protein